MTTRDLDDTNFAPPGAPPTSGYAYVPTLGKFVPVGAVDNGDGTASMKMTGIAGVTSTVAQGAAGGDPWLTSDTQLDIKLSVLRDAITAAGASAKTLADVVAALQATLSVSGNVAVTGNVGVSGTVSVAHSIVVDANNSTATPLAAGATFTGVATDISSYQQVNIEMYGRPSAIAGDGTTAKGTLFFEFSPDGANWDVSVPALIRDPGLVIPTPVINVGKWFRVRYLNDGGALAIAIFGLKDTVGTPTLQTQFRLTTQLLPFATKELTRTLDQGISGSDPASLVRAGIMGQSPSGSYLNVGTDAAGNLLVNDATSENQIYTSTQVPTLPFLANATFTGTGWVPVTDVGNYIMLMASTIDFASVKLEWSNDGVSANGQTTTLTSTSAIAGPLTYFVYLTISNTFTTGSYFRVKVVNGTTNQDATMIGIVTTGKYEYLPLIGVEADLSLILSAVLTRSVQAGKNPDGTFVNASLGGTKTLSPATSLLGAGGVYTSNWFDTEAYPTVKLLITADQISADNGIAFQWSDTSTGVVVRTIETHTFRQGYIANGRLITTATRARYLRIVYTNGTAVQTRFFLNLRLSPVPIVAEVTLTPAASADTGQQTVTTVATALSGATLSGRKAFRLKNLSSSARAMFYGFAGSLTAANGDELAAGESVELDLNDGIPVYVITTSTAGAGVQCAFVEIA
jgi:hypothetical protein